MLALFALQYFVCFQLLYRLKLYLCKKIRSYYCYNKTMFTPLDFLLSYRAYNGNVQCQSKRTLLENFAGKHCLSASNQKLVSSFCTLSFLL